MPALAISAPLEHDDVPRVATPTFMRIPSKQSSLTSG